MAPTFALRLAAMLALFASLLQTSQSATDPEDELKAAIVLSFLRYGEWAQPAANAPVTVGVFGRASFVEILRHTFTGKAVNDRAIRLIEVKSSADITGCQVVYFASDKISEIKTILQSFPVPHVLTIGEDRDFLSAGGAVNLLIVDGKMTFEVSLDALEKNSVNISSRLLRFGQIRNIKKGGRS